MMGIGVSFGVFKRIFERCAAKCRRIVVTSHFDLSIARGLGLHTKGFRQVDETAGDSVVTMLSPAALDVVFGRYQATIFPGKYDIDTVVD